MSTIDNTIAGITNPGTATPTALTRGKKTLGKEDFLTMLIAQLKNQDPLNPMNGSDFAVQLAQFSSLEQLYNANDKLGTLGTSLASLTNAQLTNIIGSEVSAKGNTLTVNGASTSGAYSLSGDAQKVTVTIYDSKGLPVKTLNADGTKAGLNAFTWDTTNVEAGTYTFAVTALGSGGSPVAASTLLSGTVQGVTIKDGVPYLSVNGQDIAYGDVVSVKRPSL